jgi:hypothetical protein
MNRAKIVSTAKYGGVSGALGGSLTAIVVYAFPQLEPIGIHIGVLVTFVVNMLLAMTGVISDSE